MSDDIIVNVAIAEFMGAINMNDGTMRFCYASPQEPHHDVNFHDGTNGRKLDELKYHTSWDWLMPVVVKIRELLQDNALYEIGKKEWDFIQLSLCTTEIKAIYLAVVNFIKWYNQKNK